MNGAKGQAGMTGVTGMTGRAMVSNVLSLGGGSPLSTPWEDATSAQGVAAVAGTTGVAVGGDGGGGGGGGGGRGVGGGGAQNEGPPLPPGVTEQCYRDITCLRQNRHRGRCRLLKGVGSRRGARGGRGGRRGRGRPKAKGKSKKPQPKKIVSPLAASSSLSSSSSFSSSFSPSVSSAADAVIRLLQEEPGEAEEPAPLPRKKAKSVDYGQHPPDFAVGEFGDGMGNMGEDLIGGFGEGAMGGEMGDGGMGGGIAGMPSLEEAFLPPPGGEFGFEEALQLDPLASQLELELGVLHQAQQLRIQQQQQAQQVRQAQQARRMQQEQDEQHF